MSIVEQRVEERRRARYYLALQNHGRPRSLEDYAEAFLGMLAAKSEFPNNLTLKQDTASEIARLVRSRR